MFTPKGFEVSLRVSRIAVRKASGEGCESAVRMPVYAGMRGTGQSRGIGTGGGSTYLDHQLRIPLLRAGEGQPYRDSFSVKS